MTANVANGRALRYAEGSARGLLHHRPGHCRVSDAAQRSDGLRPVTCPPAKSLTLGV